MLRGPRLGDDGVGGAALPLPQDVADEGMMAVMPRGFDEDAPQVRIAGFGDGAAGLLGATRMLRGDEADEGHRTRRGGKSARVAELGGDGQRGEIVDAAEAAQPLDARAERLQVEQAAQVLLDGAETRDGFLDGAQIRAMRLIESGQRPGLRPQPRLVTFGPGLLGGGEAAAVAEQEFR